MGHSLNLKIKLEQKGQREKRSHFFLVLTVGEKERGGREHQASLFDLRSSVGRFSSGQEQKFIASTRGMRGYLEREISSRIQGKKVGKSKLSG